MLRFHPYCRFSIRQNLVLQVNGSYKFIVGFSGTFDGIPDGSTSAAVKSHHLDPMDSAIGGNPVLHPFGAPVLNLHTVFLVTDVSSTNFILTQWQNTAAFSTAC